MPVTLSMTVSDADAARVVATAQANGYPATNAGAKAFVIRLIVDAVRQQETLMQQVQFSDNYAQIGPV